MLQLFCFHGTPVAIWRMKLGPRKRQTNKQTEQLRDKMELTNACIENRITAAIIFMPFWQDRSRRQKASIPASDQKEARLQ